MSDWPNWLKVVMALFLGGACMVDEQLITTTTTRCTIY